MKSLELKWGIIIGLAGMTWLYLSYFIGMRSNGIALVQGAWLIGIAISLTGYILGLREIKRKDPELEYLEGVKSGAIMAGISTLFAVIAQTGYFKIIHPDWTNYIVGEIRLRFEKLDLTAEQMEETIRLSRDAFSLTRTLQNSALEAVLMGIIFTAGTMLFLRKRGR